MKPKTIDSYYSILTNEIDTLFIEYGMYNQKIYRNELSENLFKQTTIAGREAVFEIPNSENGFYRVYIPKIDSINGFILTSTKRGASEDISKILTSLKVDGNRPSEPLFEGKIKYVNRSIGTGITHYENNCLSCHSEYTTIVGPILSKEFWQSKDNKWLKNYLYQKKNKNEQDIECFQFDKKDSLVVKELVQYVKQKDF